MVSSEGIEQTTGQESGDAATGVRPVSVRLVCRPACSSWTTTWTLYLLAVAAIAEMLADFSTASRTKA
jgi:hypothetical protein